MYDRRKQIMLAFIAPVLAVLGPVWNFCTSRFWPAAGRRCRHHPLLRGPAARPAARHSLCRSGADRPRRRAR